MKSSIKTKPKSWNANSKEPSLFHYTRQFSYLQEMLRGGIWPRYCIEEFNWLFGGNICIAFPMVCFCDIPINNASEHRNRYGSYSVSINKSLAGCLDINPVWYLQDGTELVDRLQKLGISRPRTTLETIPHILKTMLPYLKSTIGAQPNRGISGQTSADVLAFEEEMEWRFSPLSLAGTWTLGYGRDSLEPLDHEQSLSHRIILDQVVIDQVFVTTEAEREQLEQEFRWLAGRVVVWSCGQAPFEV